MITITREGLGRALGFLILTVLILGLPYAAVAFVTWQADPGGWSSMDRAVAIVLAAILLAGRLGASRIRFSDGNDEERR